MKERKFDFGELVTTSSVQEQTIIDPDFDAFADDCFIRHICGDWEDLEPEDAELNEQALIDGDRLFSSYIYEPTGERLWIITEADRSVTTMLFPSDY